MEKNDKMVVSRRKGRESEWREGRSKGEVKGKISKEKQKEEKQREQ